ncbi:hypothetical protein BT67DRAFT_443733 [Trichocladium antarcticum]|uniref:Aminoglycoside phosphotransferase domain-containing protein n=1 Tax=Trichocladium antarcticum TaxID=1450529 RepID=A0AAN6UGY6_9PEZI|nr:hypothetical protein BT67DRAFT_443733 [Trichocladium antarcticum]
MEDLDPTAIRTLVKNLIGGPCHFILNTDISPFRGGEYAVYALEDEQKSRCLCLRIPHNRTGCHVAFVLEHEAKVRRHIDAARIDLFQPLIAYDPTTTNLINAPYLALGWADGSPLKWSDAYPTTDDRRSIMQAVANASLDLLRIQRPGETALEWITYKIDRKIARAQSNELHGGTVTECEDQKQLIPKYWMPDLNNAPHVLVHGDISGNNIIVGNAPLAVQSIIDLGWAEMVPLQFAAVYPRFLTHEPREGAQGFSVLNSRQMKKDRAFYLECVKTRATQEGGIELDYYRALSRDDEPSRYWWLTAASRIDIHIVMALCSWAPPIV